MSSVFYLCSFFFVSVVQWMHSISHQAWLLTGWPCNSLCLDSLSTLWRAAETTNRLWKTALPPALLSVIITAISSAQQPGWIHVVAAGFTGREQGFIQVHLITDSVHAQINATHSLPVSLSRSVLFVCCLGGVTDLYSPSKPEGWPHGASSCHHHSRRS